MSYTHTTFGQLKTQLSQRLGDSSQIFWVNAEVQFYLTEALFTFGLCSGFWRQRGLVSTVAGTPFYDLQPLLVSGASQFLQPQVTDQEIIEQLQYHLLESTTSQTAWTGTPMFSYNDLANAVQNRLNQFLSDTGCVIHYSLINAAAPPIGRQSLDQSIIDVRHASWLGVFPSAYYNTLWREDERLLTASDQTWSYTPDIPQAYSIMAPPPLQLQLAPPPINNGQIELLTINSVSLNPAAGATVLGIPDQLTPAIKWGALSDLLGKDGVARDAPRAQWCEQRYQMYVQLARLLPVVVHTEINGVPLIPCTFQEIESQSPTWENITGPPSDVATAGLNMIVLNPVPDNVYSVTVDAVRPAPIPIGDSDYVQVGREQLDMILDYAEHLALFKSFGAEWHATERQAQNFLMQSMTYNQRLSAAARASFSVFGQSQMQKREIPRRLDTAMAAGTLTGA